MVVSISAILLIDEANLSEAWEDIIREILPLILILIELAIFNNTCLVNIEREEARDKAILLKCRIFFIEEFNFALLHKVKLEGKFKGNAGVSCSRIPAF